MIDCRDVLRALVREEVETLIDGLGSTDAVATYPKVTEDDDTLEEEDAMSPVDFGGPNYGGYGGGYGGYGYGINGKSSSGLRNHKIFFDSGWSVDDVDARDLIDILFP